MADKQNVSKDILTVAQWEEALQSSAREGGNIVAEIFSTKWGSCRAIAPTFRRLFFEVDEAAKLKFYAVDATLLLKELAELEQHAPQSPVEPPKKRKDAELYKETLPEAWKPYLVQQNGKAKPFFMFYSAGRLSKTIQGINTPLICNTVKEMTTVKTPADNFITNTHLLELWAEHFDPRDSDVHFEKFLLTLNAVCKLTVSLTDAELQTLRSALNIEKDQPVTAEKLQAWVGSGTLMQAFTALLPQYEERAISVRIEQEAKAKAARQAAADAEGEVEAEAEAEVEPPAEEEEVPEEGVEGEAAEA
eukprot:EG_transcript_17313